MWYYPAKTDGFFRLLLCFDLPFHWSLFLKQCCETQQLSSCHLRLAIDKYQTNIIGCGFRRKTATSTLVAFSIKHRDRADFFPNTFRLSLDTGTRSSHSKQRFSVCKFLFGVSPTRYQSQRACVSPCHSFVISYWLLLKQSL